MSLEDRPHRIGDAARRFFSEIAHAPSAEGDARLQLPKITRRARRRVGRVVAMVLAFAATISALWYAAYRIHGELSRVQPPPAPGVESFSEGNALLESLITLQGLRTRNATLNDDRQMFATDARRRREEFFLAGAETASAAAFNELPVLRGVRNETLAEARTLATSTLLEDRRALEGALTRLRSTVLAGDVRFDRSNRTLETLALTSAADLGIRAQALAAEIEEGVVTERAEAGFFSARGAAYGWALILRAAAADSPEPGAGDLYGPALASLDRVAAASPLVLSNHDPMGARGPNHVAALALELELARTI